MEQKNYPLKGGLFPLIALLLALLAVVGLFSVLRPEAALLDAAGESLEELEDKNETLMRVLTLLKEGRLTATADGKELLTVTGDGKARRLTLQGEKALSLYRKGDGLLLEQEDGETYGGHADALLGYLAATASPEERQLLAAFAALTDKRLGYDALLVEAEAFFETAEPTLTTEEIPFSYGEEDGNATLYRFTAEGEPAAEAMGTLTEHRAAEGLAKLLFSLTGKGDALRPEVSAFYGGEGEFYKALCDGTVTEADFTVYDGLLRRAELHLTGKDASLQLTLSMDGTDGGLVLRAASGERELYLTLTDTVTEDDRSYLRELNLTLTLNGEETETKLRFSWGKEKKDLALRVAMTDTEYYFRGSLEEKKSDRFVFTLSRIEKNKENILPSPLRFTLTDEEEALTLPEADGDFPEAVTEDGER